VLGVFVGSKDTIKPALLFDLYNGNQPVSMSLLVHTVVGLMDDCAVCLAAADLACVAAQALPVCCC
jgi:hypothetical protein